jgi:D-serine deaminase-like pyridoxal phosphate-dependent protein
VEQFAQAARAAGAEIQMLVDVDVRLGRSGAQPGQATLELARKIADTRGLKFMGLMGYEGSMHNLDAEQRAQECVRALAPLIDTKELIERTGIPVEIVSVGASSTYKTAAHISGVTEIQAGSYLTGDLRYRAAWSDFEPAISVLTTIVSRPNPKRVTIDAGFKKLSQDAGLPIVKNCAGVRLVALNEEHGILDADETAAALRVGDQIEIIPSHGGTTINLYDCMVCVRAGTIQDEFGIEGQGR